LILSDATSTLLRLRDSVTTTTELSET
jgi:hypothetical protein